MTRFSASQRADLRDAAARSRLAAAEESRRLVAEAQSLAREKRREANGHVAPVRQPRRESVQAVAPYTFSPDPVLDLPEAQPVIARLLATVGEFNAIDDIRAHVLRVAADAVKAKRHPRNPYAGATL